MDSQAYRIRQTEIGVIKHDGYEFSALGSDVNGRHVTGYLGKSGALSRWDGGQMLPANRYVEFTEWTWGEFSDKGYVCGWRVGRGRWILGWAMNGAGSLFRGELADADDDDDARRQAESIAEHWIEVDNEDRERDAAEQLEEATA
jgi:hypothetical protein